MSFVRAAFPDASECNGRYYGYDLPAFSSDSAGHSAGKVMINARPYQYMTHCDAKGTSDITGCLADSIHITKHSSRANLPFVDGCHGRRSFLATLPMHC